MTIDAVDVTSGPYSGDDITDTFSYDFPISSKTELTVYRTVSNVQSVLTVDTDYTVTGVGDAGGGTIILSSVLATGESLFIRSNRIATQETDFDSQGGFFPDVHEASFDKLTMLVQQLLNRVILSPGGDLRTETQNTLPSAQVGRLLQWQADGTLANVLIDLIAEADASLVFDSVASASVVDLTSYDAIVTRSFAGGWAGGVIGPQGGMLYHRDGTTGTASTIYSDNSGFYDTNGDGFSVSEYQKPEGKYASFSDAMNADNRVFDFVKTVAFYGGWAGATARPVGGAIYHRDGTTGTASTAYADNSGFYDSNGDGFLISENQFKPSQFGAYTNGSNAATTRDAIENFLNYVANSSIHGSGIGDFGATYLFDDTITMTYNGARFFELDFGTATFKPTGDFDCYIIHQTSFHPTHKFKQFKNWRTDTINLTTVGRVVWTLRNCNSTKFNMFECLHDNTATTNRSRYVMFDRWNYGDAAAFAWSENCWFTDIHCAYPYRIFQHNKSSSSSGFVKDSFARTHIHRVFLATTNDSVTGDSPDYLIHVADGMSVYDSLISEIYGNNDGDATCFYWEGVGDNTRIGGIRVESGSGSLIDYGPHAGSSGIRKPRFIDFENGFGFSDGNYIGKYVNLDDRNFCNIGPGVMTPHIRYRDTPVYLSGTHDGAGNAAALTDSTAAFPTDVDLIGGTIYNLTDGSSGTITANTGTTVTATLSGGTDNDWDVSDVYYIIAPGLVDLPLIGHDNNQMHMGLLQGCVKDQWYRLPKTKNRGAYSITLNGTADGTPNGVAYAASYGNTIAGNTTTGFTTLTAPASGETFEIRWNANLPPQIRWTGGSRTNPMDIGFTFFGSDSGI